jgi:SAM-dependent methyltransferase
MKNIIKFFVKHIPRRYLILLSRFFSIFIRIFYLGNRYYCPICKSHFRKFLPYGNKGKENRLCPKCLSLERHRLIWLYLSTKTNLLSREISFLHIAPEQPFLKKFQKQKNWKYVTADLESPIADVKMDIRNMPFNNEEFDFVMCNHVLEHIDDDLKAMKEIYRVLKKGGSAILQVPIDNNLESTYEDFTITDPKEREKHFGQYDHVRVYGKDYAERLKNAGFKVEINDYVKTLTKEEIDLYRLDENEYIYIAHKV